MLICLTNVHARYWRGCPRQTPYLVAFFANLSQADKHVTIFQVVTAAAGVWNDKHILLSEMTVDHCDEFSDDLLHVKITRLEPPKKLAPEIERKLAKCQELVDILVNAVFIDWGLNPTPIRDMALIDLGGVRNILAERSCFHLNQTDINDIGKTIPGFKQRFYHLLYFMLFEKDAITNYFESIGRHDKFFNKNGRKKKTPEEVVLTDTIGGVQGKPEAAINPAPKAAGISNSENLLNLDGVPNENISNKMRAAIAALKALHGEDNDFQRRKTPLGRTKKWLEEHYQELKLTNTGDRITPLPRYGKFVIFKQYWSQCPAHVPFNIIGQHAQKYMRRHAILRSMTNRTHKNIYSLHCRIVSRPSLRIVPSTASTCPCGSVLLVSNNSSGETSVSLRSNFFSVAIL